jgi:hypothetical protein
MDELGDNRLKCKRQLIDEYSSFCGTQAMATCKVLVAMEKISTNGQWPPLPLMMCHCWFKPVHHFHPTVEP